MRRSRQCHSVAKSKARRRFNLRGVRVNSSLAIGALAASDVISGTVTNVAADKLRFISLHASWGIANLGALIDDAFTFGVAHSDYSAAEIEECLESGASIDLGDKVAQEQANRLVREIGQIDGMGGTGAQGGLSFNDGKPVRTKLNWLMSAGDALQIWVRNNSGVVYTTGALLTISGRLWVRD